MDQNYAEQQSRQDQIIYSRIERVIAYKNVQFILEHQNDTLEQLSAKNPPPFKDRKIVRDLYEVAQRRMAEKDTAGTSGEEVQR